MKQLQIKGYKLGISPYGVLAFVLIMIPSVIWVVFPPANDPLALGISARPVLDLLENIFRIATFVLLIILVVRDDHGSLKRMSVALSAVFLLAYYALWVTYFFFSQSFWVMLGLSLTPVFFFLAVARWLRNYPAFVVSILFGVAHVAITVLNYL